MNENEWMTGRGVKDGRREREAVAKNGENRGRDGESKVKVKMKGSEEEKSYRWKERGNEDNR